MAQSFGVTTTTLTQSDFLGGHPPILEPATLNTGQNLGAGTVLGKITIGAATTSGAGNTGTGTITMDATHPVKAGAKIGAYVATCIAAATNGGTFRLTDPDGYILADGAISGGAGGTVSFDNDVKFVITDGSSADFIVGDKFTITLAAGSGYYTQHNPDAEDGSQVAAAILAEACNATSQDTTCTIYTHGELVSAELIWHTGISAGEKAAAISQLKSVGLYVK